MDFKLKILVTAEVREAIKDTAYTLGCHFSDLPQTLFNALAEMLSKHDFYRLLTMKAKKSEKKSNRLELNLDETCQNIEDHFGFKTSGDSSLEKYSTIQRLFNALIFLKKNTALNTAFFKFKIEKDIEGAKALLKEQLEKAFNEDSIG